MIQSPEQSSIDYSGGEWLETLTYFETGDKVTCPSKYGDEVLTVTRIIPVRPGDMKFAHHAQYVELSDKQGILANSISASLIIPAENTEG